MDHLYVRYNWTKFHHCGIYNVWDWAAPKMPILNRVKSNPSQPAFTWVLKLGFKAARSFRFILFNLGKKFLAETWPEVVYQTWVTYNWFDSIDIEFETVKFEGMSSKSNPLNWIICVMEGTNNIGLRIISSRLVEWNTAPAFKWTSFKN